jgi:glycosyltransferase involved in cell wall biosynthesis
VSITLNQLETELASYSNCLFMQVLLTTCGAWYFRNTAKAFDVRQSLAALWCTEKNNLQITPSRYRRCWPFHLAMVPLYFYAPQIWIERAFYKFFPIWRIWQRQQRWPQCDVVHSIMGYATEPFDEADARGCMKVLDCPNSHPTSYYGYWQRECDLWCAGEQVPIPRWMFARMNRELQRADLVLCPSQFVRDTMVANGVPAGKCFINPFGVDTAVFSPNGASSPAIRFVSVGTICLRKGHQYLFRAFEQVKKRLPAAELVCVGQYKGDFRKERAKWEGSFKHYPSLTHPQLAELLKTCSAFVLTSVEEGFARVISEAMATGLPVIATYESGASTLVENGREGLIVPAGDPERTADAMLKLAQDQGLRRRMAEAAYTKGAVRNGWQDYGDRLLAEYAVRLQERSGAKG